MTSSPIYRKTPKKVTSNEEIGQIGTISANGEVGLWIPADHPPRDIAKWRILVLPNR
jgi:hypothetical protein